MTRQSTKATEIVQFKTIDGVSGDDLMRVIDTMNDTYLTTTDGYVDSELIQGADEQSWILVVHWRTMAEATVAIRAFPESPATEPFRSLLDLSTINLHFGEQEQVWGVVR